jgi:RNA polymerase sigma factor (sigma-70 family)
MIQDRPQQLAEPLSPRGERQQRLRMSFKNSGEHGVQTTRPILLRIGRRIGLCAEAAWDVLQEAYCTLLSREQMPDDIESWLKQVMRFQSWRWLHDERVREGREVPLEGLDLPLPESIPPERRIDLRRALAELTIDEFRILYYHYAEGLTEREAALRAGYAPSSGKKTLARIRKKLYRWVS